MVICDRKHLSFKWLVGFGGGAFVGDGKDFIDEKFEQLTISINLLELFVHLIEWEEDRDGFRGEEVGVDGGHVEQYYLNLKIS